MVVSVVLELKIKVPQLNLLQAEFRFPPLLLIIHFRNGALLEIVRLLVPYSSTIYHVACSFFESVDIVFPQYQICIPGGVSNDGISCNAMIPSFAPLVRNYLQSLQRH